MVLAYAKTYCVHNFMCALSVTKLNIFKIESFKRAKNVLERNSYFALHFLVLLFVAEIISLQYQHRIFLKKF